VSSRSEAKRILEDSAPPDCTAQCGKCTPCGPITIRKPPSASKKMDAPPYYPPKKMEAPTYYPKVWRCTCGGKLFLPHPPQI